MSLELIDFRGKITPEIDAALEAVHRVTGRDRAEIARSVLAEWAAQKIHEASLLDQLLQREGLRGIVRGVSGSQRESQGVAGSGRDCPDAGTCSRATRRD
jgi:hypothetical protein